MTSNIFGRGFDSRRLHHYRVALALIFLLSVPCFSQQRGERTLDEIKSEAIHRAENGMYPFIGRDAADVRASFIALVGTLSVIPTIPVAGMALILGIDRVLSMFRATGQHGWKRGSNARAGALGRGIGSRNPAAALSPTGVAASSQLAKRVGDNLQAPVH